MDKERQAIWDKSGGRCWYCGCELPEKGWHIDHVEPIVRSLVTGKPENPESDTEANKVPACASCNINKHNMPIESWRNMIQGYVKSLNRDSTQYKLAKRYGLIEEKPTEVTFWFENNRAGE